MMSKYNESYGKDALAINQRHPTKPYKKPFCALATYFELIEKGLFTKSISVIMDH